jgi:ribosome-binding protein aMBF1 (putative translation factor)
MTAECYRCGISDEEEKLFDAISGKGVIKICKSCATEENLPLVQSVYSNQPEKTKSVYERLSAMANLDPVTHRKTVLDREKQDTIKARGKNTTLRDVIDYNLEKKKPQPRTDLVENFHWVIMRARRSRKLTQKQLAENIGEPEMVVKNAEEGIILNNSDTLVRKLENYLGAKIRKVAESPYAGSLTMTSKSTRQFGVVEDPAKREIREKLEKGEATFDAKTAETLNISDLQEINKKKESENPKGGFFSFFKKNKKSGEEESSKEDSKGLSDDEVDDILFRK